MNLRQLEVFYAIMQTGTVSGAAKNLHVSQPNVTRVLAHTEQQLGFALFERVKGRLIPTPEAQTLLPEAERVYQQLGQFRALTNKVKKGSQHIRIGAPPVLATKLLPEAIAHLRRNDAISFELATANRDELCHALLCHELDVAVCFGEDAPTGVAQLPLLKETMVALLPYSLSRTDLPSPLSMAWLLTQTLPVIGLDPRDPLGMQLHQVIHAIDPNYYHPITVRSYAAAAELALHGAGIAIVDPWTARHYATRLDVCALAPTIPIAVSVLYAEHSPLSISTRLFIETLNTL